MSGPVEHRPQRWLLRRLERRERRRLRAAKPPVLRVVAVASVVDGYCELLGPAGNDDVRPAAGRARPALSLVST
jgi:hypothetical protein